MMRESRLGTRGDNRRPIALWMLLAFMALRIFGDLHALPPEHAALGRAWPQSPAHGFYTATISLTLFRAGAVIFAAILLWRRHWAGLAIAGIVFCTELYSEG